MPQIPSLTDDHKLFSARGMIALETRKPGNRETESKYHLVARHIGGYALYTGPDHETLRAIALDHGVDSFEAFENTEVSFFRERDEAVASTFEPDRITDLVLSQARHCGDLTYRSDNQRHPDAIIANAWLNAADLPEIEFPETYDDYRLDQLLNSRVKVEGVGAYHVFEDPGHGTYLDFHSGSSNGHPAFSIIDAGGIDQAKLSASLHLAAVRNGIEIPFLTTAPWSDEERETGRLSRDGKFRLRLQGLSDFYLSRKGEEGARHFRSSGAAGLAAAASVMAHRFFVQNQIGYLHGRDLSAQSLAQTVRNTAATLAGSMDPKDDVTAYQTLRALMTADPQDYKLDRYTSVASEMLRSASLSTALGRTSKVLSENLASRLSLGREYLCRTASEIVPTRKHGGTTR